MVHSRLYQLKLRFKNVRIYEIVPWMLKGDKKVSTVLGGVKRVN